MNFSEDERIALGEFCQHVLASEPFGVITKYYEDAIIQQLLTTKATETKRRDELYFNLRGARDLLQLMTELVREKARLLDPEPKPSEETDGDFDIYADSDDVSI